MDTRPHLLKSLSKDARKRALDEWRALAQQDADWWYSSGEDEVCRAGRHLGLEIEHISWSLHPPEIGAAFEGRLHPWKRGGHLQIARLWPDDAELRALAMRLQQIQRHAWWHLAAHLSPMRCDSCLPQSMEVDWAEAEMPSGDVAELGWHHECRLATWARGFARWIFRYVEREYEHMNSDEAVAEEIEANGATFSADGRLLSPGCWLHEE